MNVTLEEQKRNREVWAKALESGKFKQTKGKLGSPDEGMCCLGVGCFVLGVKYNPDDSFPPVEFAKLVGLPYDEDYVHDNMIEGNFEGGNSLVVLNDEYALPFPHIANVIRTEETLWMESDYHQALMEEAKGIADEMREIDEKGFNI